MFGHPNRLLPLVRVKAPEDRGNRSGQRAEPEGRKIVAHGAPPWAAGESAGQPRNGAKEGADAWALPPRSGAEAGPSFSQCWRTGLLSFALRAKPNTVHLRTFLWYPVLDR